MNYLGLEKICEKLSGTFFGPFFLHKINLFGNLFKNVSLLVEISSKLFENSNTWSNVELFC